MQNLNDKITWARHVVAEKHMPVGNSDAQEPYIVALGILIDNTLLTTELLEALEWMCGEHNCCADKYKHLIDKAKGESK